MFTPFQAIRQLPLHSRLCFLMSLSFIFYPYSQSFTETSSFFLIKALVCEMINGLILSLSFLAALGAFHLAGHLIDTQMGLNILAIFNPSEHSFDPLMSRFYTMLTILLFFSFKGHHYLFEIFTQSLTMVPLGTLISLTNGSLIIKQFSTMFYFALIIAGPILLSLLLIDISAAILSKSMPNINTYFLILPIKILISYVLILVFLPNQNLIYQIFHSYFETLRRALI